MKHSDPAMEQELENIRQVRSVAYKLTAKEFLILLAGIALSFALPPLAIIVWLVFVYLLYLRIKYAARIPCPRCKQPFGSSARVPVAVGGVACQNCDLHLYLGEGPADDTWNA